MDVLWAPWRMQYILGPKPDECVFCLPEDTSEDRERLVLYRGRKCFVIMNKFPYNSGHLMVCPFRHVSCLTDLDDDERMECMNLLNITVKVMQQAFSPQGINAGLNLGEAAGAGIAAHMHFQVVPRWNGDVSFMALFGETRVVPQYLDETWAKLKPLFETLCKQGA